MSYKPIIYKLFEGEENPLEIVNHFIATWYEIELKQCDFDIYNFGKTLGISISKEINQLLNYLTHLNYTIIRGKKRMIYSSIEYLFRFQNLKIGYDDDIRFLFLFQEGRQDLYYGIPQENLLENNPPVFRLFKNKEITLIEDCNMIEFLVSHVCIHASKVGVKEFGMFIPEENEIKNKIEKISNLFDYKTDFNKITLFERNNGIATIQKGDDVLPETLTVNSWSKEEKEFIKEVECVLGQNGWSDNTYRYKL